MTLEYKIVEDPEVAKIKEGWKVYHEFNDIKHFYCDKCSEPYSDELSEKKDMPCYKCKCGGRFIRKSPCSKCGKDYEFTHGRWGKAEDVVCSDCKVQEKHLIIYGKDIEETKGVAHDIWHYSITYPWINEETTKPGGYKIRTFSDYYDLIHTVPFEYATTYGAKYGPYDTVYFANDIQVYQIGTLLKDINEYAHKDTRFNFSCVRINLKGLYDRFDSTTY